MKSPAPFQTICRTACLAPLCFTLLTSCAWTGGLASTSPVTADHRSSNDPYLQRFHALQREIDRLQLERDRIAARLAADTSAPTVAVSTDWDAALQTRVARMLARLGQLKDRLAQSPVAASQPTTAQGVTAGATQPASEAFPALVSTGQSAHTVVVPVVQNVAHSSVASSASTADVNPAAKAVQQTDNPAITWNYSVVYRYADEAPWQHTWQRLEAAGEQDKWRGSQAERQNYFIYVGVYAGEVMAQRRVDELQARLGEAPLIVARPKATSPDAGKLQKVAQSNRS